MSYIFINDNTPKNPLRYKKYNEFQDCTVKNNSIVYIIGIIKDYNCNPFKGYIGMVKQLFITNNEKYASVEIFAKQKNFNIPISNLILCTDFDLNQSLNNLSI